MLASALWRHIDLRSFEQLEEALLHTLTAHIACDTRIVALACNLVNLVDEHDASLGFLDIIVGSLEQSREDTLDILAHITCFGEHGGIDDGKRHVQHLGDGAC